MYLLDQKSRAPKRRKPSGTVKEEDISEEEAVTQEKKNTKRQLAKRRRPKSGVTEDEVGDVHSLISPRPKSITVCTCSVSLHWNQYMHQMRCG